MVEFVALAAVAFTAVVVLTVLASVFSLVVWLVFLPFRVMGWAFKALALVFALPFIALFGILGFVVFGAGMLVFLVPILPFVLIACAAWWLVRRAPPRTGASFTR